MIAFASLFLGLVFGPQMVEVVVGDTVAAVEIRLDGERLVLIEEPPWRAPCDLGAELAPRHLEAVAYDAGKREMGRASQWLNLPQPRAAANVVFEPREPGAPRVARLSWESAAGAKPESVKVILDGQTLPSPADPRHLELPPVDESQLHLLQVEMEFEGRVKSRVDLTFGGQYVDEVSTEITAVPIVATDKKSRPPSLAAAQEWFEKNGEPLRVVAIEKANAQIVIVLDRPFPRFFGPGERYRVPRSLDLEPGERVRFLSTVPRQSQGVASTFELFPVSPSYGGEIGDFYRLLTGMSHPAEDRAPRPGSAVAVAGLSAFESGYRRAVVLLPDMDPPPEGSLEPARAKRYLERLGVPFVVWNPRNRTLPHLAAWGRVEDVSSIGALAKAFEKLRDELESQWIVWLDGRHLPQDVGLTAKALGFELLPFEPGAP